MMISEPAYFLQRPEDTVAVAGSDLLLACQVRFINIIIIISLFASSNVPFIALYRVFTMVVNMNPIPFCCRWVATRHQWSDGLVRVGRVYQERPLHNPTRVSPSPTCTPQIRYPKRSFFRV